MTLRLVTDNVEKVAVFNPRVIPSIARTFADKVEAGEFGVVERCIVIVETDRGLAKLYWGDEITHIEAVGILHMALADASDQARDSYADDIAD